MNYFLNLLMSGLVIGSLYGLIAMGFAIVYRATGMVNFAVGEVMMMIAYISFNLAQINSMGFAGLLLCTIPVAMIFGLMIERVFIRPMLGEPMFSRVMVTIGLAVVIRSTVILIWGVEPKAYPVPWVMGSLDLVNLLFIPDKFFLLLLWPFYVF